MDINEKLEAKIAHLQSEIDDLRRVLNTEPPDPEPLECWGNLFTGHIDVFLSKDTCKKEAGYGEPVRTVINLREVTPQDEQDRQDATRYRELVENLKDIEFRELMDL